MDLDSDGDGILDNIEAKAEMMPMGWNSKITLQTLTAMDSTMRDDGDPTNVLPSGSDVDGANSANALAITGADGGNDGKPDTYPASDDPDGDNFNNYH